MSSSSEQEILTGATDEQLGDRLHKAGRAVEAVAAWRAAAEATERPSATLCMKLAKAELAAGNDCEAAAWALRVVDAGDDFAAWQGAAGILARTAPGDRLTPKRSARLALLGSYTTSQFAAMLPLAARAYGVELELYEAAYGQYRQEILEPGSGLYAFKPDFVVLAVHEGDVAVPAYSDDPAPQVEAELRRWRGLWQVLGERSKATVIQHNFALPCEQPFGHLGCALPGSRYAMVRAVNAGLFAGSDSSVAVIDCEHLAGLYGKRQWFDRRFWHLGKYAVAPAALPMLARHTAAVVAARLGLARKCLVLDLDNTLWGGVIGEDGLAGITLGDGVDGEAFVAFQEYILQLKARGVLLAVCSKNDDALARAPFESHPEMRMHLDDIACFVANWRPKSENIRQIAERLNIGLDSLVFVDDSPVEREIVRQQTPEVDVVVLPTDPTGYVRALSEYLGFEPAGFTGEDARRTEQYRARAQVAEARESATSIEEFYASLRMEAVVAPFDEMNLSRITQLIGKTNQFNLTTRRHNAAAVRQFMEDPGAVTLYLRLSDRFTDHGLVGVMIAEPDGDILDIDTWLMSCRVIGRTVEAEMLAQLCRLAAGAGCKAIRGTYIPTAKNTMVKDIYEKFGFSLVDQTEAATVWLYDLESKGPIQNGFIHVAASREADHEC